MANLNTECHLTGVHLLAEIQKRQLIINAAQEIISENGLKESKISDIAKKAGVVDSIIYYYFKNKEDMLFWCLDELMKKAIDDLAFLENKVICASGNAFLYIGIALLKQV